MVLYFTVSTLLMMGFLALLFHGTVRNEIETVQGLDNGYEKIIAYTGYILAAVITSYVWPVSLIVLGVIALVMWAYGYDYSRR